MKCTCCIGCTGPWTLHPPLPPLCISSHLQLPVSCHCVDGRRSSPPAPLTLRFRPRKWKRTDLWIAQTVIYLTKNKQDNATSVNCMYSGLCALVILSQLIISVKVASVPCPLPPTGQVCEPADMPGCHASLPGLPSRPPARGGVSCEGLWGWRPPEGPWRHDRPASRSLHGSLRTGRLAGG